MYEVDERDRVRELTDVPKCSVGAPCPVILADELDVHVAYYLRERVAANAGLGEKSAGAPVGILSIRFQALLFGLPNDEAFAGHPLANRGLSPYGAYEVLDSSWIRRLEKMNSVHPNHSRERFLTLRHFIFAFHDTTFECVARSYSVETAIGFPCRLLARRAALT